MKWKESRHGEKQKWRVLKKREGNEGSVRRKGRKSESKGRVAEDERKEKEKISRM